MRHLFDLETESRHREAAERNRKLKSCGSHLIYRYYADLEERPYRLVGGEFCQQSHWCDACAAVRAAKAVQKAIPKVNGVMVETGTVPYLLTLTSRADDSLPRMVKRHGAWWSKWLAKRRAALCTNRVRALQNRSVMRHFVGGIVSCEVKRAGGTNGEGKWHFHAHGVVLGKPGLVDPLGGIFWRDGESSQYKGYARGPLADEWSKIVGYEANIDLRPFRSVGDPTRDMGRDLLEVFKYALKTNQLSHEDHIEAACVLQGKRLIRGFGEFHGYEPPEEVLDETEFLEALPFLELVYDYMDGEYLERWR